MNRRFLILSQVLSCCLSLCSAQPANRATLFPLQSTIPTNGAIDDVKCNVEDLETANDSQLHTILRELVDTDFFRHFWVDLDHGCPLEEEEFECDGGALVEELDPGAEKSCTVDLDGGAADPGAMFSNALHSLQSSGFESPDQKKTFNWDSHSDPVVADDEIPCDDETFWNDLCSSIGQGDKTTHVNLSKNPEINTGYNGTHIWKAIYEENCVAVDEDAAVDVCLEERVMYRLLSGLHTQTTIGIAQNYYPPSKRKNRTSWEPNPEYFMEKFGKNPQHIRNLHFSFAVLLRALSKAAPTLQETEIKTGNVVQDEAALILLKRLLETTILKSCSTVFEAFDESELFRADGVTRPSSDVARLQRNFKGVFHNISSILDCVQCQQCKLHGKMAMTGYGAALKVLLAPKTVSLERNEIVALVNSVAKFSESIRHVRELTHLYWVNQQTKFDDPVRKGLALDSIDLVDRTVGAIAELGKKRLITSNREEALVQLAFERNVDLLIAAKHYGDDLERFALMVENMGGGVPTAPDAVVIGSGLAGMAATLTILDRGGRVVLLEKEHLLGGNSNKASSGINAYRNESDAMEVFLNDTIKSAGSAAQLHLIDELVSRSPDAVEWLQSRVNVDLSLVARLGGHSMKRTHRPSNGMVGAEIIFGLQREVKKYQTSGQLHLLVDTQATKLLKADDGQVIGVETKNTLDGKIQEYHASNVILATGGFASDRTDGSYLDQYRPELVNFPATAGPFSTGDGISMATELGATTVDMDKVQIHPTGWVDPSDPENKSKILAAELMRGVGGLLLNSDGDRFCNEVGTRAYVSDRMLRHEPLYARTNQWDASKEIPEFFLILPSAAAADALKHVNLYVHKGLLTKVESVGGLARHMNLPKKKVGKTFEEYLRQAATGEDKFGKTVFNGLPSNSLERETFYVGKVVPVLHYCMGGITIDKEGHVLDESGEKIPRLYASGEVAGGVHGANRLAGNSLLECTVFGRIVGQSIDISSPVVSTSGKSTGGSVPKRELRTVPISELEKHNTPEDCWVSIHGIVYDLTLFADEHPAGPLSIHELAGKDGTKAFSAVHSIGIMDDFDDERIGRLESVS